VIASVYRYHRTTGRTSAGQAGWSVGEPRYPRLTLNYDPRPPGTKSVSWRQAQFTQYVTPGHPAAGHMTRVGSGPCPCSGIWHGSTRFCCWSGLVWSFLNSATRTGPDPSRPDPWTKFVHVEIERTSLRPDKVRGLVGDPSGPWFWSGRVRVVWNLETTRPDPTSDKVRSGPSSRIWT